MWPDRKPPALLFGDDQRTQPRPQDFVSLEGQDFFESDGLHYRCSSASTVIVSGSGGGTGQAKPKGAYDRASSSIGLNGRTPVACSIWIAASGQSVAMKSASASRIPAKAFPPHFIESS